MKKPETPWNATSPLYQVVEKPVIGRPMFWLELKESRTTIRMGT